MYKLYKQFIAAFICGNSFNLIALIKRNLKFHVLFLQYDLKLIWLIYFKQRYYVHLIVSNV